MFKSGPFRDAYVVYGLDPRKDRKWAKYQTVALNLRREQKKSHRVKTVEELWEGRFNHLFTGTELFTFTVTYSFADLVDPILKKLLDESPLLETFHV